MGEPLAGIADRAFSATRYPGDPQRSQPLSGQCGQINMPMPGTGRDKGIRALPIMGKESIADLITHLVSVGAGTGAQPSHQARTGHSHGGNRGLDHARGKASPAGVDGPQHGTIQRRQQHRQAIGMQHGQDHTGAPGDRGIGLGLADRLVGVDIVHMDPVDLLQPAWLGRQPQRCHKFRAIRRNPQRVIARSAAMAPEIQGIEGRRRHTQTMPPGRPGVHTRGSRPMGGQEEGNAHLAL